MITIRTAEDAEKNQIYKLWQTVFGDSEDYLDLYFGRYFDPEQVRVAVDEGRVVSMCSSYLHAGLWIGRNCMGRCPAAFAGATYEASRGSGLGLTLIQMQLMSGARGAGNGFSMLAPAEESLYTLYGERFGMRDYFYAYSFRCRPRPDAADTAPDSAAKTTAAGAAHGCILRPAAPAEYNRRREFLLHGKNHLAFTDSQIALEAEICALEGGGLFFADCGNGGGICAVEPLEPDFVRVNELLVPEEEICGVLSMIRALYPAAEYEVRMCPFLDADALRRALAPYPGEVTQMEKRHTGMLLMTDENGNVLSDAPLPGGSAYAGFVYD